MPWGGGERIPQQFGTNFSIPSGGIGDEKHWTTEDDSAWEEGSHLSTNPPRDGAGMIGSRGF